MARQRHLRLAPISEALIDFRVAKLGTPPSEATLPDLQDRLGADYPVVERQQMFAAGVRVKEASITPAATSPQFRGFLFRNADRTEVVQFRVDGFTFNRLKPYTSWEEILPRALHLWNLYVEVTAPEAIARLAVRYINRLAFSPPGDLSRFLEVPLAVPPEYPGLFTEFLVRMRLQERDKSLGVIVTQAAPPSTDSNVCNMVLDIDAFTEDVEFQPRDVRIRDVLEMLRVLKNRIFFGTLTEEVIGGFE